jgi:UDP-GlcNAc:undecaprenyl-phosphate GlcNAc-1-phosphate transferase
LGDLVVGGAVIAGAANLLNLFDLRPGRALKVVLLVAPAAVRGGPAGRLVAAAAGAAVALLPADLREKSMLGDTGANAAGALLGTAAVAGLSRRGRIGLLLGLSALTLASEKVSFTKVIARTPGLRELDQLGRRPAAAPAPAQASDSAAEQARQQPGKPQE